LLISRDFPKFQERPFGQGIDMREEVIDRFGNVIYLADERWQHIIKRHRELDGYRKEVLSTIRSGKRRQDPLHTDKFYYYKNFSHLGGQLKGIEVVVLFRWKVGKPNNFVLTAYPD
jgi:hypothetical protein